MKFACYSCGHVLHNGLPPMEALDVTQSHVAGVAGLPPIRHDALKDTVFDGMSIYQFCTFCVYMVQEFPTAFNNKSKYRQEVIDATDGEVGFHRDWVYRNRLMVLRAAQNIYGNGDFTLAMEIIEFQ